jgi:hypothetical protein
VHSGQNLKKKTKTNTTPLHGPQPLNNPSKKSKYLPSMPSVDYISNIFVPQFQYSQI